MNHERMELMEAEPGTTIHWDSCHSNRSTDPLILHFLHLSLLGYPLGSSTNPPLPDNIQQRYIGGSQVQKASTDNDQG